MAINIKLLTATLFGVSLFSSYMFFATSEAFAANSCAITVENTDAVSHIAKTIAVSKTCKEFAITLKNTGKHVKGNSLVITKASDQAGVLKTASRAGEFSQYVKAKDQRVIAFTKVINSGESATTVFSVSKLNSQDAYVFFCSYPSHALAIKGTVKLV